MSGLLADVVDILTSRAMEILDTYHVYYSTVLGSAVCASTHGSRRQNIVPYKQVMTTMDQHRRHFYFL